jgi:hypothetical protein
VPVASIVPVPVRDLPTKIIQAVPRREPERDPHIPYDRDVIVGDEYHTGTMLLGDLVRTHYFLWRKRHLEEQKHKDVKDAVTTDSTTSATETIENKPLQTTLKIEPPTEFKDVEELTVRLIQLFSLGRKYVLLGLKDVPTPFFKGEGRFFEKISSDKEEELKWKRLNEDEAKGYVSCLILTLFQEI